MSQKVLPVKEFPENHRIPGAVEEFGIQKIYAPNKFLSEKPNLKYACRLCGISSDLVCDPAGYYCHDYIKEGPFAGAPLACRRCGN